MGPFFPREATAGGTTDPSKALILLRGVRIWSAGLNDLHRVGINRCEWVRVLPSSFFFLSSPAGVFE